MIDKYEWVCSTCSQGLTRKSSAKRHNNNLHSGSAMIVRPFEYIIGRLNGKFPPTTDPLLFRRKNKNDKRRQNGDNNSASGCVYSHDNYNNDSNFDKKSINKFKFNNTSVAHKMKWEDPLQDHRNIPRPQNKTVMRNEHNYNNSYWMPRQIHNQIFLI